MNSLLLQRASDVTTGEGYEASADTQRTGRRRQAAPQSINNPVRRRHWPRLAACAVAGAVAAIVLTFGIPDATGPAARLCAPGAPVTRRQGYSWLPGDTLSLFSAREELGT
jgi:hypothetical protein